MLVNVSIKQLKLILHFLFLPTYYSAIIMYYKILVHQLALNTLLFIQTRFEAHAHCSKNSAKYK